MHSWNQQRQLNAAQDIRHWSPQPAPSAADAGRSRSVLEHTNPLPPRQPEETPTVDHILSILDRSPSYTELREQLEAIGVKLDRAAFAESLLTAGLAVNSASPADVEHAGLLTTFPCLRPDIKERVLNALKNSLTEDSQQGDCMDSNKNISSLNAVPKHAHYAHSSAASQLPRFSPTSLPAYRSGTNNTTPSTSDTIDSQSYQYMPNQNDGAVGNADIAHASNYASPASVPSMRPTSLKNARAPLPSKPVPPTVATPAAIPEHGTAQQARTGLYHPHLSLVSTSSGASSRPSSFTPSDAVSIRTSMSSFADPSLRHPPLSTTTRMRGSIACSFAPACPKKFSRTSEQKCHEESHCRFNPERKKEEPCLVCVNICTGDCPPGCDTQSHKIFWTARKWNMVQHWQNKHKLKPQHVPEDLKGALYKTKSEDGGSSVPSRGVPSGWAIEEHHEEDDPEALALDEHERSPQEIQQKVPPKSEDSGGVRSLTKRFWRHSLEDKPKGNDKRWKGDDLDECGYPSNRKTGHSFDWG